MSSLKTLICALLLAPTPLVAETGRLMPIFAACTGRFSAEMEHAWLMNDALAYEHEHRRGQFIDLLETIVPAAQRRHALSLRIEAKHAHAALLTQARFSNDSVRAQWATARATAERQFCESFLLES